MVIYGYYCQHIADNIAEKFSRLNNNIKLFWRAARTKIKALFNTIIT